MKQRCIVIGFGWAGQRHARAVAACEVAELAAIVEWDAEKREQAAAQYSVPVFAEIEDVLAGISFQTAIVATLPTTHAELCGLLLKNGKHVLCEKPLSRNVGEVKQLAALAEKQGVQLGVVFNQRYGHVVQMAKNLLSRDLSSRQLITASMYQNFPKEPQGHFGPNYLLTDSCCHLLDLMTYLIGPAVEGSAVGYQNQAGICTNVAAVLQFENGCVGTMAHSAWGGVLDTQHPYQQIDIHTEQARYCIENTVGRLTVYPHGNEMRQVYEPSVFERRDYDLTLEMACQDYLRAVAAGKKAPVSVSDALQNAFMIEHLCSTMIKIYGKQGKEVRAASDK